MQDLSLADRDTALDMEAIQLPSGRIVLDFSASEWKDILDCCERICQRKLSTEEVERMVAQHCYNEVRNMVKLVKRR